MASQFGIELDQSEAEAEIEAKLIALFFSFVLWIARRMLEICFDFVQFMISHFVRCWGQTRGGEESSISCVLKWTAIERMMVGAWTDDILSSRLQSFHGGGRNYLLLFMC